MNDTDTTEDDDDLFASLFVCEDYVVKHFDFNGIKVPLLCSNAAMVS